MFTKHSVDSYSFHVFAFALDPVTNLSVDIAQLAFTDSLDGFTTSARGMKMTKVITTNVGGEQATKEIECHFLEAEIRRSKLSQALGLCILTTTWILTLLSVLRTFAAVTKGRVDFAEVALHSLMAFVFVVRVWVWKRGPSASLFGPFLGTLPTTVESTFDRVPSRYRGIFLTSHHCVSLFHGATLHGSKITTDLDQDTS